MVLTKVVDPTIHHCEPNGRQQRQEHHARIAGWHLRGIVVMSENLILATGQVVVIGVATELKQKQSPNHVIAVPAVLRHRPFIFSFSGRFPLQPVMLDVVDGLQQ